MIGLIKTELEMSQVESENIHEKLKNLEISKLFR